MITIRIVEEFIHCSYNNHANITTHGPVSNLLFLIDLQLRFFLDHEKHDYELSVMLLRGHIHTQHFCIVSQSQVSDRKVTHKNPWHPPLNDD